LAESAICKQLEPGLMIIDDGAERSVESGFIDITALDASGAAVVIELDSGLSLKSWAIWVTWRQNTKENDSGEFLLLPVLIPSRKRQQGWSPTSSSANTMCGLRSQTSTPDPGHSHKHPLYGADLYNTLR
jgi:hypothetical protein